MTLKHRYYEKKTVLYSDSVKQAWSRHENMIKLIVDFAIVVSVAAMTKKSMNCVSPV
jgi:hypothetical protein